MKNKDIKRIVLGIAGAILGSLGMVGAVNAADESWGPQDRATFTWETPASYVTFNSITDNPSLGDERNFVRVRKAGTDDTYSDAVNLEVGAEYEVLIYYHNNASANLNESGKGIAQNVAVSTGFPEKLVKGDSGVLKGTIFSSNANPTSVWDTAYLRADSTVYLRYVANSAVLHNDGSANGSVLDADSLFDSDRGAKIAQDSRYWGIIPGCNEYAGYITYRFKVDQPGFHMEKTAKIGDADYGEKIGVKPGDTIDFKIVYKNIGTTNQTRVVVFDKMPEGMKYINGTTYVKTPSEPNGIFVDDFLFDGGLIIGDFYPGETAEITYKAEIVDDKSIFPCGTSKQIYNNSSVATANGTEYDKVEVTVTRNCQAEDNGCFNEDGTVKDTPECKCVNEDGTVKDTEECRESGLTTPGELPSTGPTEIVLTTVVLAGAWVVAAYWYASHAELKKIQKKL